MAVIMKVSTGDGLGNADVQGRGAHARHISVAGTDGIVWRRQ
jgi:hypothetical protein